MAAQVPIAISYRPKRDNYLPAVVAAIRRHLGDWPIFLLTQAEQLPPRTWLERNAVQAITDWEHTPEANKVLRLWEHQGILAAHFDRWIWWHDDMLLLRPIDNPVAEFSRPLVRHEARARPNKKLSTWNRWLWDTLDFFACQGIPAPNPVLHIPRLIDREVFYSIPGNWNRRRLLFEPTYLLWHWQQAGLTPELAGDYRFAAFRGDMPDIDSLAKGPYRFLVWGRKRDHDDAREVIGRQYPLDFGCND